ncbi:MAG: pyridoxamine 5'-phosphate oxidase family protein [Chloroflexota bacterium]|nr:pyridoxamine 5'-phosphate oxidase family protein [Chloroflexota bacterium]
MSQRTTIKRHPERTVPDHHQVEEILARGVVAHLGFAEGAQPVVIPLTYGYDPAAPDRILLHGSHASRTLKHLATGAPVCVTVTTVQGLVYSRTAPDHSMNYESVIIFGTARPIKDVDQKAKLFREMIERYHPGRTPGRDYQPPTREDLMSTAVVEVQIEEMSAKVRTGGPRGRLDSDPEAPGTCGVI